jgi:hypothetical protein
MRRSLVWLLHLTLASELVLSACRTDVTVRRRNWPQGTGTNDSSAMATAQGVHPVPWASRWPD